MGSCVLCTHVVVPSDFLQFYCLKCMTQRIQKNFGLPKYKIKTALINSFLIALQSAVKGEIDQP
jgi:hypothetical protein